MVNIGLIYIYIYIYIYNLLGGANTPYWKMMEFVNGKDDIPYMKWKIKAMFETTNQSIYWVTSRVRIKIPKIGLLDSVLDYERPLFINHI